MYWLVSWRSFRNIFILESFPRLEAANLPHLNQKPDCEDVHDPLLHAPPGPSSPPTALLQSAGSQPAYDPT